MKEREKEPWKGMDYRSRDILSIALKALKIKPHSFASLFNSLEPFASTSSFGTNSRKKRKTPKSRKRL